jgi:DNA-binding response OmpR family regulator
VRQKQVLVVDDEPEIRKLLLEFLLAQNLDVLIAEDGTTALELAQAHIPDLVITDFLLPREHGIDVVRTIKERFFIPVIGISGIYGAAEVNIQLEYCGLDGFFPKPLDLNALWQCVQLILNG